MPVVLCDESIQIAVLHFGIYLTLDAVNGFPQSTFLPPDVQGWLLKLTYWKVPRACLNDPYFSRYSLVPHPWLKGWRYLRSNNFSVLQYWLPQPRFPSTASSFK
jgi:hypothetical protein